MLQNTELFKIGLMLLKKNKQRKAAAKPAAESSTTSHASQSIRRRRVAPQSDLNFNLKVQEIVKGLGAYVRGHPQAIANFRNRGPQYPPGHPLSAANRGTPRYIAGMGYNPGNTGGFGNGYYRCWVHCAEQSMFWFPSTTLLKSCMLTLIITCRSSRWAYSTRALFCYEWCHIFPGLVFGFLTASRWARRASAFSSYLRFCSMGHHKCFRCLASVSVGN